MVVTPVRLPLVAAALLLVLASTPASAATPTIVVDPTVTPGGRIVSTLQQALDRAGPGDVIRLRPGVHVAGARTVRDGAPDRPITVTGPRKAIVVGGGSTGRVLQVRHDHIVLRGFTVDGLDPGAPPDDPDSYRDVLVYVTPTEVGDRVVGCRLLGLRLQRAGGEAVRLRLARDCEIADNRIVGTGIEDFALGGGGKNGEGIYIGTSPSQLDRLPGGVIDDSHDIHIHHNLIRTRANEAVNTKEGTHDVLIEHNLVVAQRDPDAAGINVQGDRTTVRHNWVRDTDGAGIRLGESTATPDGQPRGRDNVVVGNVLRDNDVGGLKLMSGPQGTICGNDVRSTPAVLGPWSDGVDPTEACPDGTEPVDRADVGPRRHG